MTILNKTPSVEAYFRFLQLAAAVEALPGMDQFGVNERALFQEILLAWSKDEPLTVRMAIDIEHLGSPATLHKRVSRLRNMDLIDAVSQEGDRRTKYLLPTSKGLKYVDTISKTLHRSMLVKAVTKKQTCS